MSLNATCVTAGRLLEKVDHLVYSTTDFEKSIDEIETKLGVQAARGGQHLGRGTRPALIALSASSYLAIVGPDSEQPATGIPRWFEIDTITTPRLVAWAAKGSGLTGLSEKAAQSGVALGPVVSGKRKRDDGAILHWQFTDPTTVVGDGLVPFFIDWEDSPHPAASAPGGPALVSLRGEHPEPAVIERALAAVGISLPIEYGPVSALIATLKTPAGVVELR